jgi:UDP-2,3-diacylglucosamine pyrophosphatase LpxH
MLIIISDLHLGDGTCGKSISPSAFHLFASRMRELAYQASWRKDNSYKPVESIDLVLLGDILDPQHSMHWLDTQPGDPDYTRPWTDPNAPEYAVRLRRATRAILEHNAEGLKVLRDCARGKMIYLSPATANRSPDFQSINLFYPTVRIHYMVGNHDWYYRLPGQDFDQIRQEIIEAIGLSNPVNLFPWEVEEWGSLKDLFDRYKFYGRHGDVYDKFNYDSQKGRNAAALGDAFAVEMLNRYPLEVARQLGSELPLALVDSLRKLTNIRPALVAPLWISGQIKQHSPSRSMETQLKKIWDNMGQEFLNVDFVRQADKAFKFDMVDGLQLILGISRRTSFKQINDVVVWARNKMWGGQISYVKYALEEPAFLKGAARYVAYGHTHNPEVIPLDSDGTPPTTAYQMYMNSGSWHSYYTLTVKNPKDQKFVPYQMLSYLVYYRDDQRGGRHFESWSGAFA